MQLKIIFILKLKLSFSHLSIFARLTVLVHFLLHE